MAKVVLDFEKPIYNLQSKIDEMRTYHLDNNVDLSNEIDRLEKKVHELKKSIYSNLTRWQRVQLARHPERPYTLDYIYLMFSQFTELHGDRNFGDDKAIVGGFAQLGKQTVMVVGHQKGRDTKSNLVRNFGMPNPEGYRKALRLFKLAEKFNKPVITFIDTPGAFPGLEAEERGQGEAIARNLFEMAQLKVPVICAVIGEGASGGALGIGVGDKLIMMENTWYSVISPESCSSILWHSWDYKEQAAEALKLTAQDLLDQGLIDRIVEEPLGGAHHDPAEAAKNLKKAITEEIKLLKKFSAEELVSNRIEKYSKMGVYDYL
ncbi:MAG: acetyl-CoA carboxylase carboxyltransferase subunit alpha [Bacteroidetes bacterium]|nr:acetyl-CoA carboxylase carboxyltransferase subunit alpha [Bacteroidota bacterium]